MGEARRRRLAGEGPRVYPAGTLLDAKLEDVTDADRAWFLANPGRRYRLRPTALAELLPGETMRPGSRTLVTRHGSPLVRSRLRVRPPPALAHDTDACCAELVRRLCAEGHRINGRPLAVALGALDAVGEGAR